MQVLTQGPTPYSWVRGGGIGVGDGTDGSVVTVIETGTETAFFLQKPNRNRGFMRLY